MARTTGALFGFRGIGNGNLVSIHIGLMVAMAAGIFATALSLRRLIPTSASGSPDSPA
ncbi:MAG: hypothetical protein AB8H80_02215 [Planctomycetota bacterium]